MDLGLFRQGCRITATTERSSALDNDKYQAKLRKVHT